MTDHWYPRCEPPTGLVAPVRLDPEGRTGPTWSASRSNGWRRSSHGLLVPSAAPRTVEQRIVEQAARLPEGGMVTGWAALRMAGARYFEGQGADGSVLPVPVLIPHASRRRAPGLLVERTRRPLAAAELRYGVRCAPCDVALLHELVRCVDRERAGVMVDMALAAGVVGIEAVAALRAGRRLPPPAAYALARACPDCRSPKESEMLQVWQAEAGFSRPLMNRAVLDGSGQQVAVVDLLDVEAGAYGEYNGAAHRGRERQRRDEERSVVLRRLGLEGFVLVAGDSRETWLERMREARRRALWLPEGERRWRVGPTVLASDPPQHGSGAGATAQERAVLAAIRREEDEPLR